MTLSSDIVSPKGEQNLRKYPLSSSLTRKKGIKKVRKKMVLEDRIGHQALSNNKMGESPDSKMPLDIKI